MARNPKRGSFRDALRALDHVWQHEPMPPEAEKRFLEALDARTAGHARRRYLLLAPAALAVVVVAIFFHRTLLPPDEVGPFTIVEASPDAQVATTSDVTVVVRRGRVTLARPSLGLRMKVGAETSLRGMPEGARLLAGRIEVEVTPRRSPRDAPVRIHVSHGVFEVVGTRFTLVQRREGGSVTLDEGHLRFLSLDGRRFELWSGQRLTWPVEPPVPPPNDTTRRPRPTTRSRAHRTPPPPRRDFDLGELQRLRIQGRFERLEELLRRATRDTGLPAGLRESLSFELGDLLGHVLRRREAACRQWRWHLRTFPRGTYRTRVASEWETLGCRGMMSE